MHGWERYTAAGSMGCQLPKGRAWGSVMGHVIQQQDSMRCRCRAGCDADAGLDLMHSYRAGSKLATGQHGVDSYGRACDAVMRQDARLYGPWAQEIASQRFRFGQSGKHTGQEPCLVEKPWGQVNHRATFS